MATLTIAQAIAAALDHHRAGRLAQAEAIYRQILAAHPDHPDALHLLGVIAHQVGQHDQAIALLSRAVQIAPKSPEFHNNLGEAYRSTARIDDAIGAYQRAIELRADYADPHLNLGLTLAFRGRIDPAVASLRRAIQINPRFADAHLHLGRLLFEERRFIEAADAFQAAIDAMPDDPRPYGRLGAVLRELDKIDQAEKACRKGVEIAPNSAEAHYNLGVILQSRQKHATALTSFNRAIELDPAYADAYVNLALCLGTLRRMDEAIASLRRAIELNPNHPQAWCNLGANLHAMGDSEQAISALARAVDLNPNLAEAFANLGLAMVVCNRLREAMLVSQEAIRLGPMSPHAYMSLAGALHKQGLTDEALLNYRRARDLQPGLRVAHQNVLLTQNYLAGTDPAEIFKDHLDWADKFGRLESPPVFGNVRDPDRKLRIGYVSPDFRLHSVAFFVEPILANHDKEKFEIFCYSDSRKSDATTDRLRSFADHWRQTVEISHETFVETVRAHQLDILIDLAGHTSTNRMPAFAQKPAPVQVTYLGYPNTTGLKQIDYRLTDEWADPAGMTDPFYTEALWRLPRCAWCYRPFDDAPPVAPPPFRDAGHITFGSYNKHPKMQPATMDVWVEVLKTVPRSRLVLKSITLGDEDTRKRVIDDFLARGIDRDRIEALGSTSPMRDHLDSYRRIDIALDTFPYNGTTTTCDSLYMGVPVIALAGTTHVSRVGVSLLNAVGLPELVAKSTGDYIRVVAELANDADRLSELRSCLRHHVESSPLMDAIDMTRQIESAYGAMWRKWCESSTNTKSEAS